MLGVGQVGRLLVRPVRGYGRLALAALAQTPQPPQPLPDLAGLRAWSLTCGDPVQVEIPVTGAARTALAAALARRRHEGAAEWATAQAVLLRVPSPEDSDAVAVFVDGTRLGHLPRASATAYQPALRRLDLGGRFATADALLHWFGPRRTEDVGVVLHLSPPGACLPLRLVDPAAHAVLLPPGPGVPLATTGPERRELRELLHDAASTTRDRAAITPSSDGVVVTLAGVCAGRLHGPQGHRLSSLTVRLRDLGYPVDAEVSLSARPAGAALHAFDPGPRSDEAVLALLDLPPLPAPAARLTPSNGTGPPALPDGSEGEHARSVGDRPQEAPCTPPSGP